MSTLTLAQEKRLDDLQAQLTSFRSRVEALSKLNQTMTEIIAKLTVATLETPTIKYKKVRDVTSPTRGTELSAGLDFYVPKTFGTLALHPGSSIRIPSGIIVEIPRDKVLIGFNKSGVATKKNLQIGACVIDADYQGEIHLHLTNIGNFVSKIEPNEKIAQFLLLPIYYATLVEDENIHQIPTERGTGGFGHTDKKIAV